MDLVGTLLLPTRDPWYVTQLTIVLYQHVMLRFSGSECLARDNWVFPYELFIPKCYVICIGVKIHSNFRGYGWLWHHVINSHWHSLQFHWYLLKVPSSCLNPFTSFSSHMYNCPLLLNFMWSPPTSNCKIFVMCDYGRLWLIKG